ncbi:MAG: ATP-binding cassette domain-containing protein, partial [Xanthomonadaceae bacterium]|nr:ATP-binding cassette domain-containing protein [Xanthomonadaceae bacterium]
GKTTMIDLIAGLLRPDSGAVRIDDVDLNKIDHMRWRKSIGYVAQEALLINDSVRNNITLGAPDLGEQAVREALIQADALDFVMQMDGSLDASVGERGGRLSGGQRQRLAIARALVHQPALLILDEATSNLDQAAERAVLETIANLKGKLTMLAVTHQHPLLEIADRVYRIDRSFIDLQPADAVDG